MNKKVVLRLIALLSLLPPALAALVCDDFPLSTHPKFRVPAHCWPGSEVRPKHNTSGQNESHHEASTREVQIKSSPATGMSSTPTSSKEHPSAPSWIAASLRGPPLSRPHASDSAKHSKDHKDDDPDDTDDEGDSNSPSPKPSSVIPPFYKSVPYSPLSKILAAPALPPPDWNSSQQMHFNVNCKESSDLCEGFVQTLNFAGWYISQVPLSA